MVVVRILSFSFLVGLLAVTAFVGTASEAHAQVVVRQGGTVPSEAAAAATASSRPERSADAERWSAGTIGVPLWDKLGSRGGIIRPGANLVLRGGANFGYFGVLASIGAMWVPVDFTRSTVPSEQLLGRSPLTRLHASLGARIQYPTPRVTPYAELLFDFNAFNFRNSAVVCGVWYCSSRAVYQFAPGWTSRVGVSIAVKPPVAIDVGVSFAFSYPGNFFDSAQYWMEPYLGVGSRF